MEDFSGLAEALCRAHLSTKNVGTWKIYFEEPGEEINMADEIENRLSKLLTHAFRRPIDKKVSQ